jgi:pimeloyl-ACP methyl ester carboxylesterase
MTKPLLALLAIVTCTPGIGAEPVIEEARFASEGVELAGTIVLPAGDVHAGVVFIHGSGKQERNLHWARKFADAGIAALVYDKRGVGKSGGVFEDNQNVSGRNLVLLAEDASNALQRLAQHRALRGKPLGFGGISQAGWIAPLAAAKTPLAKFLVLWSGPVCKVSEEDIYSKHTADRDGMFAPPFAEALASRKQKYLWPDFLGRDTDSAEDLAKLSIPGLWIFSDNDSSIPVDLSLSRLRTLRQSGHAYDYVLFSGLGHNNMDGTFTVATDWIRQRK